MGGYCSGSQDLYPAGLEKRRRSEMRVVSPEQQNDVFAVILHYIAKYRTAKALFFAEMVLEDHVHLKA
jgi:hypothetical protein